MTKELNAIITSIKTFLDANDKATIQAISNGDDIEVLRLVSDREGILEMIKDEIVRYYS